MSDSTQDPQSGRKVVLSPLPDWLQAGIDRLRFAWAWFQARRTPTVDRWLAVVVVSNSLIFLGTLLVQQWADIAPYLQEIQIMLVLLAFGAILGALILGGLLWYFVQKALDIGLDWQMSLTVHFSSMITKYVPGYGWQYMAKAYLSRRGHGQARRIGLAMMTELGILIMGGLILAGLVAGRLGGQWVVGQYLSSWGWYLVSICAGVIGMGWVKALERLGDLDRNRISYVALTYSIIMAMIGWVVHALAVWLITRSLFPVTPDAFAQMLFALILSNIVSILVIVVPGGIGVREITLTLLLTDIMPLSLGGVIAILARLILVIAEVALFGLILLGQRLGSSHLRLGDRASLQVDNHKERISENQ